MLQYLVWCIIVFYLWKLLASALFRFILVPSQHWQDKIKKVIDYPQPIYLKVGWKRSAYRRRLILASDQPSFYTNYVNNKLKIFPGDKANPEYMEKMKNRNVKDVARPLIYGFFHPYANNGGGGERVLWAAVQATLAAKSSNIVAIYTSNADAKPLEILQKVESKFQIGNLDSSRIVFIYLKKYAKYIDSDYWKHFTIVGQLIGSVLLALEALFELAPDIWIDTQGLPASNLPVSHILNIPILSYVHYPVLQKEMFNKLSLQSSTSSFMSLQSVLKFGKYYYWLALYYFYVYLGSLNTITLTNGSWTNNHIREIWTLNLNMGNKIEILYPPCGDLNGAKSNLKRENKMLYIAQFRPEKRHQLILEQYHKFLISNKSTISVGRVPKLVFLGSCRTPDDTLTLETVRQKAKDLELEVEFVVDCSYEELINWSLKCTYGLNAMWNEHFGIGVVEYLMNGLVPVVHGSAGPLLDIVTGWNDESSKNKWYNNTGFFFKDESDPDFKGKYSKSNKFLMFDDIAYPSFSQVLQQFVVDQPDLVAQDRLQEMRQNGLNLIQKFSNREFVNRWMDYTNDLEIYEKEKRNERDRVERVY